MDKRTLLRWLARACLVLWTTLFLSACSSAPTVPITSPSTIPTPTLKWKADSVTIDTLTWSPNGTLLASGGFDTAVQIWDATNGNRVTTLNDFHGGIAAIAWSPNGRFLITCSNEPQHAVRLWDTTTWQVLSDFKPDPDSLITSVTWSPDSQHIAVGLRGVGGLATVGGALEIWDIITARRLARFPNAQPIESVVWSPQGTAIAAGTTLVVAGKLDCGLLLWDVSRGIGTLAPPRIFRSGTDGVTNVAWSPDQKSLVSGSGTEKAIVQIWDVATGTNTVTFHGHTTEITGIAWSPDQNRIASSSWDTTVRVWDVTTQRNIVTFTHDDYVNTLVWSPTALRIAAGDHQGRISIWDVPK